VGRRERGEAAEGGMNQTGVKNIQQQVRGSGIKSITELNFELLFTVFAC